ncbi:unnamed protein product, partial [Mesorhabditis spiculigera]
MSIAEQPGCSNSGRGITVNRQRQEGNPVLKYVRNVRFEWGDIPVDFEVGRDCGVLYLALTYHRKQPHYIHSRIDPHTKHMLWELNRLCATSQWTLILCYSVEEAAEYLENLKLSENRDPSYQSKKGPVPKDERERLLNAAIGVLTGARSVTKTDAKHLLATFGSLSEIAKATEEQLALCPGLGPIRAKNLHTYLRTNLRNQLFKPH